MLVHLPSFSLSQLLDQFLTIKIAQHGLSEKYRLGGVTVHRCLVPIHDRRSNTGHRGKDDMGREGGGQEGESRMLLLCFIQLVCSNIAEI
jgi:hypothetical protein